jgi:hypothetical protein
MKTFQQFREAAGDKFSKMTDQQFRDWQRSNPGAAEKAQKLRDAARSATPKPVGSGAQLPNVPKPSTSQPPAGQARWNSGQRFNDPRAQAVYDRMRQQAATRVAPRTTATVAAPVAAKAAGVRYASRLVPGLQTALGVASAVNDLSKGDLPGAALSGVSAIPGPIGYAGLGGRAALELSRSQNKVNKAPKL